MKKKKMRLARKGYLPNVQQWQENPLKGPINTYTAFQSENLLLSYLSISLWLGIYSATILTRYLSSIYPYLLYPHFSPDTHDYIPALFCKNKVKQNFFYNKFKTSTS